MPRSLLPVAFIEQQTPQLQAPKQLAYVGAAHWLGRAITALPEWLAAPLIYFFKVTSSQEQQVPVTPSLSIPLDPPKLTGKIRSIELAVEKTLQKCIKFPSYPEFSLENHLSTFAPVKGQVHELDFSTLDLNLQYESQPGESTAHVTVKKIGEVLPYVKHLNLSRCHIADERTILAIVKAFPELETLDLSFNGRFLRGTWLCHFAELPKLQKLILTGNREVFLEDIESLQRQCPHLEIVHEEAHLMQGHLYN